MAASEEKDTSSTLGESPEPAVPNATVNGQASTIKNEEPESTSKRKSKSASEKTAKSAEGTMDGKLTGAAAKKKAKEEKAARRAMEKQGQQTTNPQAKLEDVGKGFVGKEVASATQTPKSQHKRAGSTAATQQKSLTLKPAEQHTTSPVQQGKKDDKKVALFGHLYGMPRRTTIAGAGKDIHPAVLALGLQISKYIICGSNARCVATLLIFKRVCAACDLFETLADLSRSLNHTSHLPRTLFHVISLPICRLRLTI